MSHAGLVEELNISLYAISIEALLTWSERES